MNPILVGLLEIKRSHGSCTAKAPSLSMITTVTGKADPQLEFHWAEGFSMPKGAFCISVLARGFYPPNLLGPNETPKHLVLRVKSTMLASWGKSDEHDEFQSHWCQQNQS